MRTIFKTNGRAVINTEGSTSELIPGGNMKVKQFERRKAHSFATAKIRYRIVFFFKFAHSPLERAIIDILSTRLSKAEVIPEAFLLLFFYAGFMRMGIQTRNFL